MKKWKIFGLLTVVSLTLLAGCSTKEANNTQTTDNNAPVTEAPTATGAPEVTAEPEETNKESLETVYPFTLDVYTPEGTVVTQTFEHAPEKVITNMPSATDLLLELGLEDKIVGILKPDNAPAEKWTSAYEKLTVVADKRSVSKEAIIGAEPDLVFGRAMPFTDDTMGTIEQLNDMGIPVYTQVASNFIVPQTLDNVILDVRNIGKIFNVQEKANAYADSLQEKLDNVLKEVSNLPEAEPVKVLFMVTYSEGTFNTFGANSTLQESMLSAINAENALAEGTGSLSSENLIAINPDVIVYITSDRNAETDPIAVESMMADETIATVPAIANEKVITIPYDNIMDYGTRLIDTLEQLYEFIYK